MIKEVFFLRFIACLSVVLLHSIGDYISIFEISNAKKEWLEIITILLCFGTPTFIFISELVLSKVYKEGLPRNFWSKRIKYIFIPYICMAFFYATLSTISGDHSIRGLILEFVNNVFLVGYHGYFILIIFQFYMLHWIFCSYLKHCNPRMVLLISFIINAGYLGIFNFISPPQGAVFQFIWNKGYWLPFLGWIFYFCLAYYCGRYYAEYIELLRKYKVCIVILTIISSLVVVEVHFNHIINEIGSKRIDVLLLTISLILLISLVASYVTNVPKIVNVVSKYSFGIYLLHVFCFSIMKRIILFIQIESVLLFVGMLFIGSVCLSIIGTNLLNRFKYGAFLVGKLGREYTK